MQYIIMMSIVLWMAVADIVTGLIKAYITGTLNSTKMRQGALNKIGELIVMTTGCGLEAGIKSLSRYYDSTEQLAAITGTVAAIVIFTYILIMEMISILENYAEINPEAVWARKLLKKLKQIHNDENNDNKEENKND